MFVSLRYGENIRAFATDAANGIRIFYLSGVEFVKFKMQEHFYQQRRIQVLRNEVEKLRQLASLSVAFAGRLNNLSLQIGVPKYNPSLKLTRALSYVRLGDYNKVWLEYEGLKSEKIYGLLYRGMSAGIVILKDYKPMALLQGDGKCIFSVYISDKKLPGVIFGNQKSMLIKYIPPWMEPKIGDEVVTSGLDGIFFEGVKVGKITQIIEEESYKSAIVEPYAKISVPGYFHIIDNN